MYIRDSLHQVDHGIFTHVLLAIMLFFFSEQYVVIRSNAWFCAVIFINEFSIIKLISTQIVLLLAELEALLNMMGAAAPKLKKRLDLNYK